jgi:type I restriction enzyme S subunit
MTAYVPDQRYVLTEWAYYWLSNLDFGEFMNPGAVPSFSEGYQSSLPLLRPSSEEQRAISDFLDRETAKIDALLTKNRTLIERLKEKRNALISRAVTQGLPPDAAREEGLDPHPKLKPSGIEWFGDVPNHWGMGRVSGLFRLRSGGTPDTDVTDFWDGDIPWVSAKDMKSLRIFDTEDHITERGVAESATSIVPSGTVLLVARSGILKHTLPVAVAQRPVAINQDIKGFLPATERINGVFFAYWVQGNQSPLLALWRQQGATVESLDIEAVKTEAVPLPPENEQRAIAKFLDRETAKIDKMTAKVEIVIARLQEYRIALITAAVTGKIDVRGAVV